jgi:hypothetical protein
VVTAPEGAATVKLEKAVHAKPCCEPLGY